MDGVTAWDTTELEELAAKVAGADASLADPETLMRAALGLERAVDRLRAAGARVHARLEAEGATVVHSGLRTGGWLAWEARQPADQCRRRVRTAVVLHRDLPELAEAFEAGRVGWAHVEVLVGATNCRNLDRVQAALATFIDAAAATDEGRIRFDAWARQVRAAARRWDTDGGYDPNEDLAANRLRIDELPDGTRELAGRLVGEGAVSVTASLEALADELFEQFTRDHGVEPSIEVPSRTTLLGLALVEACRRATSVDVASSQPARTEAIVLIDTDPGTGAAVATDTSGRSVSTAALEVLLPGADVRGLLLDGEGNPLVMGRSRRLATPSQRAALAARDGGCIFPGCDRPPEWCDAHHQPPWEQGGRTDVDEMALCCRMHHRLTHQPGWTMEPHPILPQRWRWTTPSGRTLTSQRHGRT